MTKKDFFEIISAYSDGETTRKEAVEVERKLSERPELQDMLMQIQKTDNAAKAAFDDMLAHPVDIRHAAQINKTFAEQKRRQPGWRKSRWTPAIAASILAVLISLGIGVYAFEQFSARLVAEIRATRNADNLALATLLQEALETKVSGVPTVYTDNASAVSFEITPTHTYESTSGHWCREFSERLERDGIVEIRKGLACRETQGQWRRLTTTIEGELNNNL